jgi:hypothetical protein
MGSISFFSQPNPVVPQNCFLACQQGIVSSPPLQTFLPEIKQTQGREH